LVHRVTEFDAAVELPYDENREADQKIGRAEYTGQAADYAYNHHSDIHKSIPRFLAFITVFRYYKKSEWMGK